MVQDSGESWQDSSRTYISLSPQIAIFTFLFVYRVKKERLQTAGCVSMKPRVSVDIFI